tara:strand:- start:26030 stop:26836 length:807 start_codon:yes stop_codon:yes gene_type:complete
MKTNQKLKVKNFVWLAISLLIMLALIGISFFKQSRSSRDLVHTWEVKNTISNLISSIKDAETGQRGYVITSETDYLAPYHTTTTNYERNLNKLKELALVDSVQIKNINTLDSLIRLKFKQLDNSISLTEAGNDSLVIDIIKTDLGKKYMDDIRSVGKDMFELEEEQLDIRIQKFKNWRTLSIVLALISALLVIYCLIKIYREVYPVFTEIVETRKELHNASANLSETVSKLKKSEDDKLTELKEREIEINAQNLKIEQLQDELKKLKS